ncbi:MAG: HAD family hydrolase [Myxococcota bacterium]
MADFKAVLLDIDGTLIDSNDAHAQAWVDVLSEFGYAPHFNDVRRLIGKGGDKLLPEVTKVETTSTLGKLISEKRTQWFLNRYAPGLRPFPHARELLERFRGDGYRLVTATSANSEELAVLLRVAKVEDLIHQRTSSSDAKDSKPDPDIVKAALDRAECEASRALFLGDTPYDVEAAQKAKVRVVALRSGGWRDEDLRGSIAIYDDVTDLLAHYRESPFAAQ